MTIAALPPQKFLLSAKSHFLENPTDDGTTDLATTLMLPNAFTRYREPLSCPHAGVFSP
jgi:hypothetical protein